MPTDTISISGSVGGVDVKSTLSRSGNGGSNAVVPLPAAKTGSLSTRGGNNAGTVTSAGHGLTNAQVIDVFWAGGCQYGCTVGNVTTNTFDISSGVDTGSGSNLPAQGTAVTFAVQVQINIADFSAASLEMFVVACDQLCHVQAQKSGAVESAAKLMPDSEPWLWYSNSGANPMGTDTVVAFVAANGSTMATTLRIGMRYDT